MGSNGFLDRLVRDLEGFEPPEVIDVRDERLDELRAIREGSERSSAALGSIRDSTAVTAEELAAFREEVRAACEEAEKGASQALWISAASLAVAVVSALFSVFSLLSQAGVLPS